MKITEALFAEYPRSYRWCEKMRYRFYNVLEVLFPRLWCGRCHSFSRTVDRRHMNTMYCEKELNYTTTCLPCFEEIEEDWQAMWDELR